MEHNTAVTKISLNELIERSSSAFALVAGAIISIGEEENANELLNSSPQESQMLFAEFSKFAFGKQLLLLLSMLICAGENIENIIGGLDAEDDSDLPNPESSFWKS